LNKKLLSVVLLLIVNNIFSQDLSISRKEISIKVNEDLSFVKNVSIFYKKSPQNIIIPIIYDTELEAVTDLKLYEIKRNRYKEIKKIITTEEEVELEVIASKKVKSVYLKKDMDLRLDYKVSCGELMYFSKLELFSYDNIDTLNYKIEVPKKLNLDYKLTHKNLLDYIEIDSVSNTENIVWNIKTVPQKIKHDPLQYFGIYKNLEVPLFRVLVYPNTYDTPISYMNNWYFTQVKPTKLLSSYALQKIDELTNGVTDEKKIVKLLYDYVRNNFKYVAIEVGMGAFIPTEVNEVFSNKQGDCKDLSNFLSAALNYKGIKSSLALAATFDHISDCDFPSLSSANHVICVTNLNGEEVLLDPTDEIHEMGTPVQSLQGRTIFNITENDGKFIKVAKSSPKDNKIFYKMNLQLDSESKKMNGSVAITYKGSSGNYLKRQLRYSGKELFDDNIKDHFTKMMGNQTLNEFTTLDYKSLNFTSNIMVNGKVFTDASNTYLFLDFLPRLIETEERENLLEGTYLRNPYHKNVELIVTFDNDFIKQEFETKSYNEKGIELTIEKKWLSKNKLKIAYDFVFENDFVEQENVKEINSILNAFKENINDPIILNKL